MKIEKLVKYEGTTRAELVKGKIYSVEEIDLSSGMFTLKGVDGKFPANLFNEVDEKDIPDKQTFIAFAKLMPEIGKMLYLIRINKGKIEPMMISEIIDVSYVEGDIYRIETENSVYLTEITG